MNLKKIATRKVVTILPDATVQDAAKKMRDEHVGDLVVIESKSSKGRSLGQPIGIITDRDIVLATVAFGLSPSEVVVADVMAPTLVKAKAGDSLYHLLNLMKEHGVKRVPIVDDEGALEGIVSSNDVISVLSSELGDIVRIQGRQHQVESLRRKKLA